MTQYMVVCTVDPSKVDEFLEKYMDVIEAVARGEGPAGNEMIMTYLAYETNSKVWEVWESTNREALEKFYKAIPYFKSVEITTAGLVSHPGRAGSLKPKATPPMTPDAVEALNRIRQDLELALVELAKEIKR